MTGPGELDEQGTHQWQSRIAQKRKDLSTSVEETLAENSSQEEDRDEEQEESDGAAHASSSAPIIRPRLSLQSKSLPAVRPPEACNNQATLPPESKPRLAGRTTKVQLQAIPRSEEMQEHHALREVITGTHVAVKARTEDEPGTRSALAGCGILLRGQRDAVVENTQVNQSSVIVVTLIGDPGPVVVQYISLQLQVGFTVHLSGAASRETRFNYAVLPHS